MPRIRVRPHSSEPSHVSWVNQLVQELKSDREFGQPVILEEVLPRTGALRVTVIWDEWKDLSWEERADVVQQAYAQLGTTQSNQLTLATGLTVPEAADDGRLPYQIMTMLRKSDPVTLEQCWDAMLEQGGSTLRDPRAIELRFPTLEDAEKCIARLKQQLPGSDDVWTIAVPNVTLLSKDSRRG